MHPDTTVIFHKSSYSGGRTDNCVEVADFPQGSAVRDTQYREDGCLAFPTEEWTALLVGLRLG